MVSETTASIIAGLHAFGTSGRVFLIMSTTEPIINKVITCLVAFAVLEVQPRPDDVMFPIAAFGENRNLKDFYEANP
jgi:hypothetical protein